MFLLESLLWKVLLEDGAVVAQLRGTTAPYTTAPDTNCTAIELIQSSYALVQSLTGPPTFTVTCVGPNVSVSPAHSPLLGIWRQPIFYASERRWLITQCATQRVINQLCC